MARVESLRPDMPIPINGGGQVTGYREILEGPAHVVAQSDDGQPVAVQHNTLTYVAAWLDQDGWRQLLRPACAARNIPVFELPTAVRIRDTGTERFWFNFDTTAHDISGLILPPISVTRQRVG